MTKLTVKGSVLNTNNNAIDSNGDAIPPLADNLGIGQIAVNTNDLDPSIFFKTTTGKVVKIPTEGVLVKALTEILGNSAADLDTLRELLAQFEGSSNDILPVLTALTDRVTNAETLISNKANQSDLTSHTSNTNNPHAVTKAQVGLGNVDNTADSAKPVSTAQATAIADAKKAGTDAQTSLTSHVDNKANPHGVTAAQVGALAVGGTAYDSNRLAGLPSDRYTGCKRSNISYTRGVYYELLSGELTSNGEVHGEFIVAGGNDFGQKIHYVGILRVDLRNTAFVDFTLLQGEMYHEEIGYSVSGNTVKVYLKADAWSSQTITTLNNMFIDVVQKTLTTTTPTGYTAVINKRSYGNYNSNLPTVDWTTGNLSVYLNMSINSSDGSGRDIIFQDNSITSGEKRRMVIRAAPDFNEFWSPLSKPFYFVNNVGVGVAEPIEKLEVDGNIKTSGHALITGNVYCDKGLRFGHFSNGDPTIFSSLGSSWLRINTAAQTMSFAVGYKNPNDTNMVLTPIGLGIGTQAPTEKLTVIGNGLFSGNVTAEGDVVAKANKAVVFTANDGASGAQNLYQLLDVEIPTPANGQSLIYNSTSSKWINKLLSKDDVGLNNVRNVAQLGQTETAAAATKLDINPVLSGSVNIHTDNRMYQLYADVTDAPVTSTNGCKMLALKWDENAASQMFFEHETDDVHIRRKAGVWQPWRKLWHSGNSNRSTIDWNCKILEVSGHINNPSFTLSGSNNENYVEIAPRLAGDSGPRWSYALRYYKNGTQWCIGNDTTPLWHAGNSNKSDVDWTAKNLWLNEIYSRGAHLGSVNASSRVLTIGTTDVKSGNDIKGINFEANGSIRATLLENGNVGIGNETPKEKLDVNGNIKCSKFYTSNIDIGIEQYVKYGTITTRHAGANFWEGALTAYAKADTDGRNKFGVFTHMGDRMYIGTSYHSINGLTSAQTPIEISAVPNANNIFIKTNGYVGFGTNNPLAPVHAKGIVRTDGFYITNVGDTDINQWLIQGVGSTVAGVYKYANGNLTLCTNNTDKLVVTKDGNVGIGTETPTEKLEVNGNILASNMLIGTTKNQVWHAGNSNNPTVDWNCGAIYTVSGLVATVSATKKTSLFKNASDTADYGTVLQDKSGSNLTNFIVQNGNATINSNTVYHAGNSNNRNTDWVANDFISTRSYFTPLGEKRSSVGAYWADDNNVGINIRVFNNKVETIHTTFHWNGNTGFGTTTPTEKLQVDGNILANKVKIVSSATEGIIQLGEKTDGTAQGVISGFNATNMAKLAILANLTDFGGSGLFNGSVTATGDIIALKSNIVTFTASDSAAGATRLNDLIDVKLPTNLANKMVLAYDPAQVNSDGSKGGYTFMPSAGTGTGIVTANEIESLPDHGHNDIVYTSDERLKENVLDIPQASKLLLSLQPKSFTWTEKAKSFGLTEPISYGLIAQEVQKVMPELVKPLGKEDFIGVDYIKLIPILIEGFKQQNEQIANLSKQLETIGNRVKKAYGDEINNADEILRLDKEVNNLKQIINK